MPKVTKKIYPTISVRRLVAKYNIDIDKEIMDAGSYEFVQGTFDLSQITNAESCKFVANVIEANKSVFGGFSASSFTVQMRYDISVLGVSVKNLTLTTGAKGFILEAEEIAKVNSNSTCKFTLRPSYLSYSGSAPPYMQTFGNVYIAIDEEANQTSYLEYVIVEPEISNFVVTGTSIDSPIVCTWAQEDVNTWTVQAIQNGNIVCSKNGTTETGCTFNVGELIKGGSTTFKLIANHGGSSVEESTTIDLSYTQAKATLIDIPGATINIDEKFTIAWVSENQTSFSLVVDGKTYTGTTEKSITLPANTISKGTKTISLTIVFKNAYYSNASSISTTFTAYGKPSTPIITIKSIISSALPYITWTSLDQVAYLLTIKKLITTIETSGEILSQAKYYQVVNALENNASYRVTVKVKNQYGLWSDEAAHEFSTQFTVPNIPTITAVANTTNGAIILNVSTNVENDNEYKNTEIWKREPLGDWKRMAYNLSSDDAWSDFYVGNAVEYEYKARNIGQTGGISESDIVVASTVVKGYTLYNVEDLESKLAFKYDVEITPKLITNMVTNLFAGADAPQTSTDGVMYWNCSISFKTLDRNDILKLIKLMKNSKVLLFKDCRGHKYFGNIIGSPSFPETDLRIISVQIEFTETSFLEQDVYRGDNTGFKLIKWNGTWRFNSTQSYHS